MISFEEKTRELVKQLPPHADGNGTFPIRYDWGTLDVLNKFLLLKENVSKYPLIWLVTDKRDIDLVQKTTQSRARFVIATRSNKVDEFNEFQYVTDFQKVLNPVYDNFIKMFQRSGISYIENETISVELKPNFSFTDNKGLITIWNAIVVEATISIQGDRCINIIKF